MPVALGVRRLRALLDQRRVIFPRGLPCGLYDALPGGTPRAKSGHNGTVIPEQRDHVGVGLVEIVKLRKLPPPPIEMATYRKPPCDATTPRDSMPHTDAESLLSASSRCTDCVLFERDDTICSRCTYWPSSCCDLRKAWYGDLLFY